MAKTMDKKQLRAERSMNQVKYDNVRRLQRENSTPATIYAVTGVSPTTQRFIKSSTSLDDYRKIVSEFNAHYKEERASRYQQRKHKQTSLLKVNGDAPKKPADEPATKQDIKNMQQAFERAIDTSNAKLLTTLETILLRPSVQQPKRKRGLFRRNKI